MSKIRVAVFLISLVALGASETSHALSTLKQVQVTSGSQVDLLFDGKLAKNQIRTEFFNDIVQVVLTDAAVYPAKISSVRGGQLLKIFAYQYAPKLVRCRFTVKGKAEDLKDRFQVATNGKLLTVKFLDAAPSAAAEKAAAPVVAAKAEKPAAPVLNSEEKALLEKVTASSPQSQEEARGRPTEPIRDTSDKAINLGSGKEKERHQPLAGGKPLPGIARTMGKLMAVLALFFIVAMGLKKFMARAAGGSEVVGKLTSFAKKNLGRKEKMIEMVSSYHLGPKKSISVVRVAGRTLVLGVTQDSISLITQLAGDTASEEELEELMGFVESKKAPAESAFSNVLGAAAAKTAYAASSQGGEKSVKQPPAGATAGASANLAMRAPLHHEPALQASASDGVRNRIRSRLEGLKQL